MKNLPEEKKIRTLIDKAKFASVELTSDHERKMLASLNRVQTLLDTPATGRNQLALILSAAIRRMQLVEHFVLEGIRMDKWISQQEEVILVHLRLICTELISLLTFASDELRLVPVKVR